MRIRQYQQEDLDSLRAIHAAQGFDYPLPDLNHPLFVTKLVLSDGDADPEVGENNAERDRANTGETSQSTEQILGAVLLRLTAEAYLLLDPRAGTPRQRWQSLLALHAAAERDAWRSGLEDVHAWLPPSIATKFGKRIAGLGWVRDDTWSPYCKRLQAPK